MWSDLNWPRRAIKRSYKITRMAEWAGAGYLDFGTPFFERLGIYMYVQWTLFICTMATSQICTQIQCIILFRADFREMIQLCYPTASAERLEGSVFKWNSSKWIVSVVCHIYADFLVLWLCPRSLIGLVNCPTRWSLSLLFGYLWWSSTQMTEKYSTAMFPYWIIFAY